MAEVKDVKMYYVESDIEKIQTKTNLYLTSYGSEGAFHLVREVIQNSIDECIDSDSPGSTIIIGYDILTDTLTCEDDGRGFPETDYPIDIFCTKIQSGSKFFRTTGSGTSGEFGMGLTAVNALSSSFSLESFRQQEGYRHKITFEDGKKTSDKQSKLTKSGKQHGCIVSFSPSRKYLGANTEIPYKEVLDWTESMSYFIPKGIKIKFTIYKGMKVEDSRTFKAQPFAKLLDKICSDNNFSGKVEFSGNSHITEKVKILGKNDKVTEKNVKKDIHLDVAFRYSPDAVTYYDTYCNYANTVDGGTHQDVAEELICRYLSGKAKDTQTDSQKDKYPIKWDDVKTGLCMVVNLVTGAQVGFVGNQKRRINAPDLIPMLKEIIMNGLDEFFGKNQSILNDFIKIIKLNCKARIEMQKVKSATQKERMNSFKEHDMKNFIRCNNTGKHFKEIFLTEGDSAGGSCSNACDKNTQAFLLFRGNVKNPLKCSFAEIMENQEWKNFVTVLRCGIGKNFDINKLYYDRINIFTDSDSDGYSISSGMLVFIYTYMPELIKAGKVFKVMAPLYSIDNKDKPFVVSKAELIDLFQKKVSKHYKIELANGRKLNKDEMLTFLNDTSDYATNLIRIAKNMGNINKFFIERVIAYLVISGHIRSFKDYDDMDKLLSDQKFVKKFMNFIQEDYPEIILHSDTHTLTGIVDGHFYSFKITKRFIRHAEDLIPIYKKYGYKLKVFEKEREPVDLSIGAFLDQASKLNAKIRARYKGLGEIDPGDMFKTALDINNRVSIQYTMENAAREVEIFRKLHAQTKSDAEKRKVMMANYKINRDDLDN